MFFIFKVRFLKMSKCCANADACQETGEYLCNCKQSDDHPATCFMRSSCLSVLHFCACFAAACSDDDEYDIGDDSDGEDVCCCEDTNCIGHCIGFLFHAIACSLFLPIMILGFIFGAVCYCAGYWNKMCGCDDRCGKVVEPVDDSGQSSDSGRSSRHDYMRLRDSLEPTVLPESQQYETRIEITRSVWVTTQSSQVYN